MAHHSSDSSDGSETVWKSAESVRSWLADVDSRQRARLPQWQFMAHLLPFEAGSAFTFADLGAGTGAAARAILDEYPRARAILADFSTQMMAEAAPVMEPYAGRFDYVELDLATGRWPASIPTGLDAIVASQCLHHVTDDRKAALFGEVFERLRSGGWFVGFEPVTASDPDVESVWQRVNDRLDPQRVERLAHPTPEEAARHHEHTRYMVPKEPYLEFLRAAGFVAVDVYWQRLDYMIYGGKRP